MSLQLAYVGGLGLMASPAAKHLSNAAARGEAPANVLRVHDRGAPGARRDAARALWAQHGAELVPDYSSLFGKGDLDGVVICCGKNGDDARIVGEVVRGLAKSSRGNLFVLHLSTVSSRFVEAATSYSSAQGVQYLNYPLTGGPAGAEAGGGDPKGMLILASGPRASYERLQALCEVLGNPRYFGDRVAAGAETKLIGQHMVFNALMGLGSAASLHSVLFQEGELGGAGQVSFFDFLNNGAGGSRQWEVALKKGIEQEVWDSGFLVPHAVVDALYAADLALHCELSRFCTQPMLMIAAAFSYLLKQKESPATHAIVPLLSGKNAPGLDEFLTNCGVYENDARAALAKIAATLPARVADTVLLDVSTADFEMADFE